MKKFNWILKRIYSLGWHRRLFTVLWSTSFCIAAFMISAILGFAVLGVVFLLMELRVED